MQLGDRAQNRGEDQRHDNHLQQLHIAVTDDVEPADGFFQYRIVRTVHQLQCQTEHHTHDQADQYLFRQAPLLMAALRQQQKEGDKNHHVNNQRKIHPQCLQNFFLYENGYAPWRSDTKYRNSLLNGSLISKWNLI
ncbi:hypothetical protein D3C72_1135630 [compost metagenome]